MTSDCEHIKAEYKPENNNHRKLLETIIPKHDQNLQKSMIQDCLRIVRKACHFSLMGEAHNKTCLLVPWTIEHAHGEPAYYTIDFRTPVMQYIPKAFGSLHKIIRTQARGRLDAIEYVPKYIMSLNYVALEKNQEQCYDDLGNCIIEKAVLTGGRPMTLGSTNIMRRGSTKSQTVPTNHHSMIKDCFNYCYWNLPITEPNLRSSSDVLIYHSLNDIKDTIHLRKTILRIVEFRRKDKPESIRLIRSEMKCTYAKVAMLVSDGVNIRSKVSSVLMSRGVADSVKEGDLINAIVVMLHKRPVVIGYVGDIIRHGNTLPILSMVLWHFLRSVAKDSSLTLVGQARDISEQVSDILTDNAGENDVFHPDYAWRFTANDANRYVNNDLFPFYMLKGDTVHQTSPSLLSFLIAFNLAVKKELVRELIHMFDMISAGAGRWGNQARSVLKGANDGTAASSGLNRLLNNVPEIASRMVYSRILSDTSDA